MASLRRLLRTRFSMALEYVVSYLMVLFVYGTFLGVEYAIISLVGWVLREEVRSSETVAAALHGAKVTLALTILALAVVHGFAAAFEQLRADRRLSNDIEQI